MEGASRLAGPETGRQRRNFADAYVRVRLRRYLYERSQGENQSNSDRNNGGSDWNTDLRRL